jgi:hypothetical protein
MKMARHASIPDKGGIRIILDGISFVRNDDGAWCRVATPSADDLKKDNWYRASSSLLIRRPDAVGKVTPVKSNER